MRKLRVAPFLGAALFLCAAAPLPCGTLVIPTGIGQSAPAAPASLNPLIDPSLVSAQIRMLLYRPLVWIGQDDGFDHARSLADKIESLNSNTVFRVTLKPFLWSDGQPVTADDVVFSLELIRKLGAMFAYADQGGVPGWINSVRAVDPTHVEFTLKQPVNPDWFILNGLSVIYPLPRHAWGNPDRDTLWRHQNDPAYFHVVDGPFLLQDFRLDRYAAFVPNPLYGGQKSKLRRLVVNFLEGESPLRAAQGGELDMAQVNLALWDRVRKTPGFSFIMLKQAFGFRSLIFNLRNNQVAFLRDARVRQALTDAADQTAMIRLVYLGHSAESRAPVPVDDPAFAADAAHAPVRDDPTLAARLLDEAGWRMGPAGIRVKDGKPLSFTAMVPAEGQDQIQEMQILQRNLQDAGVEMKLRTLSLDQVVDTLQQAGGTDWQAGLLGWTFAGLPDAAGFFHTNGAANFGGYSNSTMDRLVDDVQTKPGADSVSAFVAYAAEQQPWNFLPEGQFALMVADGVQGVADFASPQGFWSPEYLHLTGKRACAGDPK